MNPGEGKNEPSRRNRKHWFVLLERDVPLNEPKVQKKAPVWTTEAVYRNGDVAKEKKPGKAKRPVQWYDFERAEREGAANLKGGPP